MKTNIIPKEEKNEKPSDILKDCIDNECAIFKKHEVKGKYFFTHYTVNKR